MRTHDGDLDSLSIGGVRWVFVTWQERKVLGGSTGTVNIPISSSTDEIVQEHDMRWQE